MADLRLLTIWAARAGLALSIVTHFNGNHGPIENTVAAVIITSLILTATFAPARYYATTNYYVYEAARYIGISLFLISVGYASATTAVLISHIFLPGLANLLRGSQLEAAEVIFVAAVFSALSKVPSPIQEFLSIGTPRPGARADVDESEPAANDPPTDTPNNPPPNNPPNNPPSNSPPPNDTENDPPTDPPNNATTTTRTRRA